MHLAELTVAGNEASDLLRVEDAGLLTELGARSAYWTVLDEGPVEACLALLVETDEGWSAHHVAADAGAETGRTEDGEALARHGGWVYVIGSHFGSKRGPLRPKRAFVARFRESSAPVLQIVRHRFALHRVVNDALSELTGPASAPVHGSFIEQTRQRGLAKGKAWVDQLLDGDHPINVEGAAFTARGTLLIGLRWPVTVAGEPILVEISGVQNLFEGGTGLSVAGAYVLTGLGPGPLGVRALSARTGGEFDVVVGSIDALDKGSVLLDSHPEARDATCRHFRFTLPDSSPSQIKPELVYDLAPLHHVEGISQWQGHSLYVTDEDHRIALYVPVP
ncbi:MAG TPA: hypothetical protein DGG94_23240 [Micromonosporaceae bacterium]|nr:hypothetical protein [Micromonosporaceae bacterium]HCU52667.1 hypothetical protein [Micromonosporaceae bacterium]